MVDAPENIGLVRGMLGLRLWNKHDDNDQSNAIAYTRSDLVAELAAENERLKQEAAEWEVIARAKSEEALTHRREAEAMMSAFANATASTGAVKEAGAKLAKAVFGVDLEPHPRDTNTVDAHETANVRDKPEGQQEPVVWASVKDHPPEVGSKFVLLYDDGSGASLYFRHDSGYIDADGDECDALDENRMWAYLPAGFDLWCEGACEPITLPKWKGPSNLRPSEQAVTERKFALGDRVTKVKGSSWTGRVVGFYSTTLTPVGYAVESETETGSVQIYPEAALKAAMEAGRHE